MFEIKFTEGAIEDLRTLKRAERKKILAELESQLIHEPTVETRNRKRLRPNRLGEWKLRIGRFRVFYDVVQHDLLIKLEAVAYKRGIACSYAARNMNYEDDQSFKTVQSAQCPA
jgi:mRNA-degrading endonuclease RelE of RelBE toxin-antitoxin system